MKSSKCIMDLDCKDGFFANPFYPEISECVNKECEKNRIFNDKV